MKDDYIQLNLFCKPIIKPKEFTFIDLFCGIGGFRVAAEALGGVCVFSSDINPTACAVYKDNFNEDCFCDITSKDSKEIPSFDLLLGGFPCQPFSRIGRLEGFKSVKGQLIYYISEILKTCQPKYFLLENVANIVNMPEFSIIVNLLKETGYFVYVHKINSNLFTPTIRNRAYFCGFRKDLNIHQFELQIPNKINKSIWFNNTEVTDDLIKTSAKLYAERQALKQRKQEKYGADIANKFYIYSIHKPNECVNTIVHQYRSSPIFVQDNEVVRLLTKKELKSIMGFPEEFNVNRYSLLTTASLFGNSVTPPVIKFILENMFSQLDTYYKT